MYSWTLITGDTPQGVDARRLRQALGAFPTGVCLVTTMGPGNKPEGMTINSFASVSLQPPLILWSIRDDAASADVFVGSRTFVLSVLTAEQQDLAAHFARPAPDKFAAFSDRFGVGAAGGPRLLQSLATYECTSWSRYQEGDHTILVGRVDSFTHDAGNVQPLAFHAGRMGAFAELAQPPVR